MRAPGVQLITHCNVLTDRREISCELDEEVDIVLVMLVNVNVIDFGFGVSI